MQSVIHKTKYVTSYACELSISFLALNVDVFWKCFKVSKEIALRLSTCVWCSI